MQLPSVDVLDRCCLRCWGLACLIPGAVLLFLTFESCFLSVSKAALTSQWAYDSTAHAASRLPEAWQLWLTEPQTGSTTRALVARVMELPLVLTAGLPGILVAFLGLSMWEEARRRALCEPRPERGTRWVRRAPALSAGGQATGGPPSARSARRRRGSRAGTWTRTD